MPRYIKIDTSCRESSLQDFPDYLKSENDKHWLGYGLKLCWRECKSIQPIWQFLVKLKYEYLWSSLSVQMKHCDHTLKLQLIWTGYDPRETGMECAWNKESWIPIHPVVGCLEASELRDGKWSAWRLEIENTKIKKN